MCSKKTGIVKAEYKHESAAINADVDLNGGPTVHGSAVCGHMGWLAGYQMSFDMSKSQLTRNNFSIAYVAKDFSLHTNVYVFLFLQILLMLSFELLKFLSIYY